VSDPSPAVHWSLPDEVEGPWGARRELAAAIRELSERCVTTEVDQATLEAAARAVRAVVDTLPSGPSAYEQFARGTYADTASELIDRTAMMGQSNPWAPPMRVGVVDGEAVCELAFAEVHVGAPGMVHGGAISAVLDQLFGYVLVMSHRRGFTGRLQVRYVRPTPLHRSLHCRAWIGEVTGRRVMVHGEVRLGDQVLVEAEALMVQMDRDKAQQVIHSA